MSRIGLLACPARGARVGLLLPLLALPCLCADPSIQTLIDNGHWKRARAAAEAAVRANPNDAQAAYYLARAREEFGNIDDGIKYAELAVKLDPKLAGAHRVVGELYGDKAEKVSVFKQLGMIHKIRPEFETAASLDPKDANALSDLIMFYLEAPGIAGGDKKKAADLAQQVAKLDAARGCIEQARIAHREKQEFEPRSCYEKALEINPKNFLGHAQLTGYYLSPPHVNYDRAAQHSRTALELEPDRIGGYRGLAMALVGQHHFDECTALLARAESAIPDDLSPYVAAARLLLRENLELPRAETFLKRYIEKTQEPEANSPHLAGAHWTLGLVYEKEGRKPDAIAELQTSLRLKPDFEPAQKDLKRLK
jgi:tetratricopeptide (TPR) repeat protein